ncbi:hypothetical protein [Streptomyces xiamenensis]|uniref:hypothetical protein n=1 Tax=Streptomyces xiamenensis TaxID=408015 RepID=UPI0037D98F83
MTAAVLAANTAAVLVIAIAPIAEEADETPQCWDCGAETPDGVDEDTARDEHEWEQSEEDGHLRCDICANPDGPAHRYDRAYWC